MYETRRPEGTLRESDRITPYVDAFNPKVYGPASTSILHYHRLPQLYIDI